LRFAVDRMLGNLAQWLRIIGYDTTFNKNLSLKAFSELSKAEQRIILTRNSRIHEIRSPVEYYLVAQQQSDKQFREIIDKFNLDTKKHIFSRCLECNVRVDEVKREDVKNDIPDYVYNNSDIFLKCPECGKVFWKGSHYESVVKKLESIINTKK